MYTFYEFLEKLKNNEFSLEFNGHSVNEEWYPIIPAIIDNMLWSHSYNCHLLYSEKEEQREWGKKSLEAFDRPDCISLNKQNYIIRQEFHCDKCGQRLTPFLTGENTILLTHYNHFHGEDSPCILKDGVIPKKTTINLPTGQIIFANHFGDSIEDAPTGEKYSQKYSLNYPIGRRSIADFLALDNYGYMQTSNMSVYVWIHKPKNEVIFTRSESGYSEDTPEVKKAYRDIRKSYKLKGSISCGVWRIMWHDISTVKPFEKDEYMDYIHTQVNAGDWELTDYCNSDEHSKVIMGKMCKI